MQVNLVGQTLRPVKRQNVSKLNGSEPLETKKARLKDATKQFESYFLLHMLKSMRETIPESGLLDGGVGKDIYTGMFDEELAKKMAGNSPGSIGEMLYKSLLPHLEATHNTDAGLNTGEELNTNINNVKKIPVQFSATVPVKTETPEIASDKTTVAVNIPTKATGLKVTNDPIMQKYGDIIEKASKKYDVNSQLIYSIIMAESSGRADAVSGKGAKGLMQLMDGTAKEMGVSDSLNINQNIFGGTKYLRKMLDKFDGNLKMAVAAYNAGPGAVSKYNGVPPYPETQQYVDKIMGKLPHPKKL
ncbi:MAG: transglycosylase SLT domain-containing protein [candidate division Zixibacteria bacterium]|nr:transglycosylase SLT domain-containing protein [candidate division Zixibacteria bacterium]